MFTLRVENRNGQTLTLTQNEGDYQVVNVDGLNPPQAIINSSVVAGMDGSKFNSSRLQERNIVITLKLNGNVEKNRINLYKYFRSKQWCKIYYKNGTRDVYIEGYVEAIDCELFSMSQLMQISIVCHDPYFKSMQEFINDISKVLYAFEFPFAFGDNGATQDGINIVQSDMDDAIEFSNYDYERITEINNDGETDVGIVVSITFAGEVERPIIRNANTGEDFTIEGTYNAGDEIIINTNKGKKSLVLIQGGVRESIFNRIVQGSIWLKLEVGENRFTYGARRNDTFMRVVYRHNDLYEGV